MADTIVVNAEPRSDVGKGASRRLRRLADRVPGILYGGGQDAVPFTASYRDLSKALQEETFFSQILQVNVGDDVSARAILRDLQRHPATDKVTHLDFMRIREDVAMSVSVPIHFVNEEQCVGVKLGGGSIAHNLIEVEITCLPKDLPEFIEVDLEELDVGFAIHLSGLALPAGVSIAALAQGADHDITVVACNAPRGGGEDDLDDAPVEAAPEVDERESDDAEE